jgi:hypothetical protein
MIGAQGKGAGDEKNAGGVSGVFSDVGERGILDFSIADSEGEVPWAYAAREWKKPCAGDTKIGRRTVRPERRGFPP